MALIGGVLGDETGIGMAFLIQNVKDILQESRKWSLEDGLLSTSGGPHDGKGIEVRKVKQPCRKEKRCSTVRMEIRLGWRSPVTGAMVDRAGGNIQKILGAAAVALDRTLKPNRV